MDFLGPFDSMDDALQQQKMIMDEFARENTSMADELIMEELGNFQRIAYRNDLTEIQSRIIMLEL